MDNDIINIKCTKEQKDKLFETLFNSRDCLFNHSCNGRSCQKCINECVIFELKLSCDDCFNKNICKLVSDIPLDGCKYFKAIPDNSDSNTLN